MKRAKAVQQVVAVAVLILFSGTTWAEVCKGSKVPKAALGKYDAQVVLSPDDEATAIQTHLPYGQPACPRLLPQHEYIICYDPVIRVALWAAYHLTAEEVVSAQTPSSLTGRPRPARTSRDRIR